MDDQEGQEGNVRIECEALPNNHVHFVVAVSGEEKVNLDLPARRVAGIAAALLNAVGAAGKLAGVSTAPKEGEALFEAPTARPTGVGLMQGPQFNSTAVVLQFGSARMAIRMADAEFTALGKALSAIGAPRGLRQ